jgi:phenylalanyl-tRNA synthetase beta chain
MYKGRNIGKIGILHPTVLEAFELVNPVSVVELTIEPFV